MTGMIRTLVALGLLLQGLLLTQLGGGLSWPAPEEALLFFSPAILGIGGAAAAAWLRRRGSAWAWVVAGIPLALLLLALALAVFLWFNPIRHHP